MTFWRAVGLFIAARAIGTATARGAAQGFARGLAPSLQRIAKTFTKASTAGRPVAGSMVAAQATRPGLLTRAMPLALGAWLAYDIYKAAPALKAMFESPGAAPPELTLESSERLIRVEVSVINHTDQEIAPVFEFLLAEESLFLGGEGAREGQIARIGLGPMPIPPRARKVLPVELNLSEISGRYVAIPTATFLGSDQAYPGIYFDPPSVLVVL
ncbi:hypothetical protein D621_21555 [beta proteobacterium AAP51]|nr:hypothetical protein D621_21555 [beta proteobacterium AAP51]